MYLLVVRDGYRLVVRDGYRLVVRDGYRRAGGCVIAGTLFLPATWDYGMFTCHITPVLVLPLR